MRILLTGCAGFIGFHQSQYLLKQGHEILGIDNVNSYYSTELKTTRLKILESQKNFTFHKLDIKDFSPLMEVAKNFKPEVIVHLAAQAGVRYSIDNPFVYAESNLNGFLSILELSRQLKVKHLVFASSSSVYGLNTKIPYSTKDSTNHPVSLYAATKKSNEVMAHSYSSLYNIPITALRFFTVYGPWGRPDMAYFSFTEKILKGEEIALFNHGQHRRDFTYIDDIVETINRVIQKPATGDKDFETLHPNANSSNVPFKVYNIGNNNPVELLKFVEILETLLNKKAKTKFMDHQPGDVHETYADISGLEKDFGFKPNTPLEVGLRNFVSWYQSYYKN